MTSRGIRNNNPGNIDHVEAYNWDGEIYPTTNGEERFCQFETMTHGCRAMARILGNYQKKYDLNTIHKMISRWAPPVENDTDRYVKFVSDWTGHDQFTAFDFIEDKDIGIAMMKAMVRMENGADADQVPEQSFVEGHEMAWSS